MPIRPTQSQTEYLVNQNTAISQVARGDKGGLIARASADWELASPDDGLHAPLEPGMEPGAEAVPADWKLHGETDLKGSWRGQKPQAADFSPSELSFAASQSSAQLSLSQSGSLDLSGFQAQNAGAAKRSESSLQLGLELRQPEGAPWLALQAGHQSKQNRTQLDTSWKPQAGLEVTAGTVSQDQLDEQRYGLSWSNGDAANPLSLAARQQCSRQSDQQTRSSQLTVKYGPQSLERAESISSGAAGVQTEQSLDWNYSELLAEGLELTAGLRDQVNRFLDGTEVASQRLQRSSASLGWQTGPIWKLNLAYREDRQPDQADPLQQRLSNLSLGLSGQLSPQGRLALSYSEAPQLRSYGLHYQYLQPASELSSGERLDLDLQHQGNPTDPQQDLSRFTAEYARENLDGRPLALESKLSYSSQAGSGRWEGELRLYGQGPSALPLEVVATLLPDQTTRLGLNYSEDF